MSVESHCQHERNCAILGQCFTRDNSVRNVGLQDSYTSTNSCDLLIANNWWPCSVVWCYWNQASWFTILRCGQFLVVLIITTLLVGVIIANYGSFTTRSNAAPRGLSCPTDEQHQDQYTTTERTRYDAEFPKVFGYPSTGGVPMVPLDIAVAQHLGLQGIEIVHRAPDQVDEDAFCHRLRLLGAKWWEIEETYYRKLIGFEQMTEMEKRKWVTFGWPGKEGQGGVWILRTRKGTGRLKMCLDMKERCVMMERLGATYYEDPREVEEFEGLFLE